MKRQAAISGFTLIEVLIPLLVLSLGLLGLAALQTTSLAFNTDAYTRTQSTVIAYDIIDKMRINTTGVSAGNYDIASTTVARTKITTYATCGASGGTCDCGGTASISCSTSSLALYDLGTWYSKMKEALPGSDDGTDTRLATIDRTAANLVTITIQWVERDIPKSQRWVVQL